MKKMYRLNVGLIETIDDIKAIFSILDPVVTLNGEMEQQEMESLELFTECCAACGKPITKSAKDAPVSCCISCFEKEKSNAIKRKIVQK